jgi:hypothetical protein
MARCGGVAGGSVALPALAPDHPRVSGRHQKGGDKVQPNYSSMEGFLAARIFTEGLRQAAASGKISRDSFISGMEGLGTQVISGFPVSFGPNDHTASICGDVDAHRRWPGENLTRCASPATTIQPGAKVPGFFYVFFARWWRRCGVSPWTGYSPAPA